MVTVTVIKGWDTGWKLLTEPSSSQGRTRTPSYADGCPVTMCIIAAKFPRTTRYEYAKVPKHTLEKRPG
jgi:hypothetical protein